MCTYFSGVGRGDFGTCVCTCISQYILVSGVSEAALYLFLYAHLCHLTVDCLA